MLPPRRVLGAARHRRLRVRRSRSRWPTPAWPAAGAARRSPRSFGATAIGWNGVQLAEVARHAPPGEAGAMTGATGFVTFSGVVVGPPLFALARRASRAATAPASSRSWRHERRGAAVDASAPARPTIRVNGNDFHDSVNFARRADAAPRSAGVRINTRTGIPRIESARSRGGMRWTRPSRRRSAGNAGMAGRARRRARGTKAPTARTS